MVEASLPSLAFVVGQNARQLRLDAGLTLNDVAIAARARGLKWSESRVADFEAGRSAAIPVNTLLAISFALRDAGCDGATVPRMLKSMDPIQVTESLRLVDEEIVAALNGASSQALPPVLANSGHPELDWNRTPRERKLQRAFTEDGLRRWGRINQLSGSPELRIAKALDISPGLLALITSAIWHSTFSDERDKRAGTQANAQKRGQVTRQMQGELLEAIEEALRGND